LLVLHFFFLVVLLNCLYLNPQVLLFVRSPARPTAGGEEQVSRWVVLVASCWVKPQH